MHRQLPDDNTSAFTLGSSPIVGNMAIIQTTVAGKISPMGQQADAVG
jgi:hypothetical protein